MRKPAVVLSVATSLALALGGAAPAQAVGLPDRPAAAVTVQALPEVPALAPGYDPDVDLRSRSIRTARLDTDELLRARRDGGRHAVVQLLRLPRPGELEQLAALGITPLAYLNGDDGTGTAYLAALSGDVAGTGALRSLVRAVHRLLPADKLDAALLQTRAPQPVLVQFFADVADAEARAVLRRAGLDGDLVAPSTWALVADAGRLRHLAAADAVQSLEPAPPVGLVELSTARSTAGVDAVQQLDLTTLTYAGLTGQDVQIGIHDTGVDHHHGDLAGRVSPLADDGHGHGTHVASIAAGSGLHSDGTDTKGASNGGTARQWRGMAPEAGIVPGDFTTAHSATAMRQAVVDRGVDVSNHSYAYNDGQYDAAMAGIDSVVRGDAGFAGRPVVFSAGNGGQSVQYGTNSGYYSLTKTCKNCLLVGNAQSTGALLGSSSHGPTADGRAKPDLVALGTSVKAARAGLYGTGNGYATMSGTSMAAPVVSGTIALLVQRWQQLHGASEQPLPSTSKALLLHAARDLSGTASGLNPDTGAATVYGAGPDPATGYGHLDASGALSALDSDLVKEGRVDVDDPSDAFGLTVLPGRDELKVTLAWDDLPGTPNSDHAARSLVNDLDLELVGPQGQVVRPLVMPATTQYDCDDDVDGTQTGSCYPGADPGPWPSADTPRDAAPGVDRVNNVEQVVVPSPAEGRWQVRVSVVNPDGSLRLPLGGAQPYSLVGVPTEAADLAVTVSTSPDRATAGGPLDHVVTVSNAGPSTALDTRAVLVLPDGVSLTGTDLPGGCVQAGQEVTCPVGDLAAGSHADFTVRSLVEPGLWAAGVTQLSTTTTAVSAVPDPEPADSTTLTTTALDELADLAVTKTCSPEGGVRAGEPGGCRIAVDNAGPSHARDVVLTDTVSSDEPFTVESVTPSQGSCEVSGGSITCQLGTIAAAGPGIDGRAEVLVELRSDEDAVIDDVAEASSPTPDPDLADNTARAALSVQGLSDLHLVSTAPEPVVAGTPLTYAHTITTSGPSRAQDAVVETALPEGAELVRVSGDGSAECESGPVGSVGGTALCRFGDLAVGTSRTMTVELRVLPDTLEPLTSQARVSSAVFDEEVADNVTTTQTPVPTAADLAVRTVAGPDPAPAGDELTWTLEVSSAGPSTARDVEVRHRLPADTGFVRATDLSGAPSCRLDEPDLVVCALGDLAPSLTRTVEVVAAVPAALADGSELVAESAVSSATDDPQPADDATTTRTPVQSEADLWVDASAVQDQKHDKTVAFVLDVHNRPGCEQDAVGDRVPNCGEGGPSDARDVVVTGRLEAISDDGKKAKKVKVSWVSPGCTWDEGQQLITCTAASLPVGESVRFTALAKVPNKQAVTSTATATSATADPSPGNGVNAVTVPAARG